MLAKAGTEDYNEETKNTLQDYVDLYDLAIGTASAEKAAKKDTYDIMDREKTLREAQDKADAALKSQKSAYDDKKKGVDEAKAAKDKASA